MVPGHRGPAPFGPGWDLAARRTLAYLRSVNEERVGFPAGWLGVARGRMPIRTKLGAH
jgi:hypothetical protein